MLSSACYFKLEGVPMVKHIVMWKFKDETTEADKLEMKRRLEALKGVVPMLVESEIG